MDRGAEDVNGHQVGAMLQSQSTKTQLRREDLRSSTSWCPEKRANARKGEEKDLFKSHFPCFCPSKSVFYPSGRPHQLLPPVIGDDLLRQATGLQGHGAARSEQLVRHALRHRPGVHQRQVLPDEGEAEE